MWNRKNAGSGPAFRFITAVLMIFTAAGLLLHASAPGKLLEIRFPASFTAFTGFTPEETLRLWKETEQPKRRYTRCSLNADGSVSLLSPARSRRRTCGSTAKDLPDGPPSAQRKGLRLPPQRISGS